MKMEFTKEIKILNKLIDYVKSSVTIGFCSFTKSKVLNMLNELNNELMSKHEQITDNMGEVSDGYHTFNELYHHRAVLFSVICNNYSHIAWKSLQHHDPNQPMYDGMFIVGIETPNGQATYHYDIEPYWDMFNVKELNRAPEWDGHTPAEAIERIESLPLINNDINDMITDILSNI